MRAFLLCCLVAAFTALGMAAGCNDLGVGKRCLNPTDAGVHGTQISSPSLECMSRLCLLQEETGVARSVCTARCNNNDDCANAVVGDPNSASAMMSGQCLSSFVCAVATSVGPFACQQVCICKDDLNPGGQTFNGDPDGGVVCPMSCLGSGGCKGSN